MKSTVSEKGQVTIPKPLRDRLGLARGQVLVFRAEQGKLIATKEEVMDPVDGVYGVLELHRSTDALVTSLRGEPDAV